MAIRMRWLLVLLLLAAGANAWAEAKTRARLVLSAQTARAGDEVLAGIHLTMAPGWHTYWRNPGESGMATSVEWDLPEGVMAGALQWPPPETHAAGGMTTYIYEGETVLIVPLRLGPTVKAGPLKVRAAVSWLECEVACVPGAAELEASLVVGRELTPSPAAGLLETWRKRIPVVRPELEVRAAWVDPPRGAVGEFAIEGKSGRGFEPRDFYPYPNDDFEVAPGVKSAPAQAGRFRLLKSVKGLNGNLPRIVAGIVVQPAAGGRPAEAAEVELALHTETASETRTVGGESSSPPASGGESAGQPVGSPEASRSRPLLVMLGLAFLGGLILNVMPCVLPVIALKVLGFVQQSKEAPQRVRQLGILYCLGVLASFLILAGLVIAVQQAGGAASWGMQMQNPYFRLALTLVVFLVALNLFGLFEVTLGGAAMGAAAGLASREGGAGAFFNGVLATALATPCTAPFLTVALGFAFTQSPAIVILMFLVTGLGLAFPYVVLSWRPGWLRFLPRPGAWMVRFKTAMGFPMLATAVWMFDLTFPAFGDGSALWLGIFLVLVGTAAWIWGEFVQRGTRRKGLAVAATVLVGVAAYGYVLEGELDWRHRSSATATNGVRRDTPGGIAWEPWSPEAVEQARRGGRVVFVDFTAKWCITCQSNKKFAIEVPEVRAKLRELDAVTLRADNTNPDPRIAAELRRFGRAGVPLVLVFPKQTDRPPLVLPALLTPGIVLEALMDAAR